MPRKRALKSIQRQLRAMLPALQQRYHVARLGIFGSYVRAEQTPSSDLDLLVTFTETPSLFRYIELENTITDAVKIPVDLVMEDALKPGIRERILAEVQFLLLR